MWRLAILAACKFRSQMPLPILQLLAVVLCFCYTGVAVALSEDGLKLRKFEASC